MVLLQFFEGRFFDRTNVDRHGTARVKAAALGRMERAGHIALQDNAVPFVTRVRDRNGREQRLRIRVQRLAIEIFTGSQFNHFPQVHHGDTVRDVFHHAQVVGDEQVGQPEFPLQVFQDIENLRLDGHIQGRDRLIADDELGAQSQCTRDPDPLALPAGELVRVAAGVVIFESDFLEGLHHDLDPFPVGADAVDVQPFHHQFSDRHARVERSIRVLEDDLHVAPHGFQCLALQAQHVRPVENHRTGSRFDQAQHGAPHRGFPAAGFPHHPEGLAFVDRETDAIHCLHLGNHALQQP